MRVNEKISSFLGLNNLLDPASADYREGMAWYCTNARINNQGLWTGVPTTSGVITGEALALDGGTGQRQMTVGGVSKLVTNIGIATEGQNGYIYYINDGALCASTGVAVLQADVPAPTLNSAVADSNGSTLCRIPTGLHYYMVTNYNDTIKRESLPSTAIEVDFDSVGPPADNRVILSTSAIPANCIQKVYRSSEDSPNIFYYIGDITSGTSYSDYRSANELVVEYEGRGTVLTNPDFIVSYGERMLYFKGNTLYWSSAGRPEEVAQKYNITFKSGSTTQVMQSYPKLSNGYGEAKKDITDLAGTAVTGALEKDGKLWLFTKTMIGYLQEASTGEGYSFKVFRKGIGALNQFVLQSCERGIFGFDGQGMWLFENSNRITRLTENRVDLSTFYNILSTYNGVWCPNLNEYWMCNGTRVIPYQADRDIFVGPYTIVTTSGCCSWYDNDGACGIIGTSKIVEGVGEVNLIFYLGQSSPTTVKQRITVEAVQSGDNTLNVKVTPLPRRDITGLSPEPVELESGEIDQTAVRCTAETTGRMIKAEIVLTPKNGGATVYGGISTINYRYDPIEWSDESGR